MEINPQKMLCHLVTWIMHMLIKLVNPIWKSLLMSWPWPDLLSTQVGGKLSYNYVVNTTVLHSMFYFSRTLNFFHRYVSLLFTNMSPLTATLKSLYLINPPKPEKGTKKFFKRHIYFDTFPFTLGYQTFS